MDFHKSYQEFMHREPDFRVTYRFYTLQEGGRWSPVYQGYKPNFWYFHEDNHKGLQFMIWPEFENEKGDIIMENNIPVPLDGTAKMWIISPDFIDYHKGKIIIGTKGFFKEGARNIAECEVIELLNIKS
ncbi:hypothetical protein [Dyadobacter sp. 3J3]|uniref:hypothetical protein n=1 Tax=Dyadobacter sp. 3J3 TaxID=2606600 RepID=UPI00135C9980|nr:hypothetical protein [Dyadobacter sp. 3J3]